MGGVRRSAALRLMVECAALDRYEHCGAVVGGGGEDDNEAKKGISCSGYQGYVGVDTGDIGDQYCRA